MRGFEEVCVRGDLVGGLKSCDDVAWRFMS